MLAEPNVKKCDLLLLLHATRSEMGCGHSKINIYPRKSRNKNNNKKSAAAPDKTESEDEEGAETELENSENLEDCDSRKTIKVRPFGGPLLAQTEISTSQQDFFKMLEDKIQNGPDYNSESETEKAAEAARLTALLKDWETASAGSRSLPVTPKRRPKPPLAEKVHRPDGVRSAETARDGPRPPERSYVPQIAQSAIHQAYGMPQLPYRPASYSPTYLPQTAPHSIPYQTPIQYPTVSPMYSAPLRQYPSYNQHGSPIKSYLNSSPKHIPYDQPAPFSPTHKLYGSPVQVKQVYSNGEVLQQQYYQQQYQQARDQQPPGYRRNYQSTVTIPIVVQNQQNEMNPLHRKQYELT